RTPRGAPLRRRTPGSLPPVLFHPAELLQDDAGVQLLEERLRLAKLLPGLELRRRPRPCEAAVGAGEDLVRRRVLLADGAGVGCARLPQVATSSSLFRRRKSAQVKSVSCVSGPASMR